MKINPDSKDMSSQNKIFKKPEASFLNLMEHNRKTGIFFFTVSLIFHGVFFGGAIFFQDFKLHKPLPPVIQIDLVSFTPEPVLEELGKREIKSKSSGISKKKSEIKKKIEKIQTIKPDISLKTKPKHLKELMAQKKKEKLKKPNIIKKKKDVDPDKILGEAREKLETKVEEQNQDRLAKILENLREKVKDQDIKQNSSPSYEKKGYKPIDLYKMVLGSAIAQNWVFNDILARMNQNLEVRIIIKILKSGEIRDIIFETRSGNRYLDESAKKAIKKANPLPELPAGMRSYDLLIGFTPKGLK